MTPADIARLAELHRECLPDSVVSRLGAAYARSFYWYVSRSRTELLELERDAQGRISSAAVVSLDPRGMTRRLLFGTRLVPSLVLRGPALLAGMLRGRPASGGGAGDAATLRDVHDMPELILIYSSGAARSQGIGARLIERLEARLRALGVRRYQVKTVSDPGNRALSFYARNGFVADAVLEQRGERFQVFTKALG